MTHPRIHFALKTVMVLSWLACMSLLVRYEAYPEYFTQHLNGYPGLIDRDTLVTHSWMRLLVNHEPIGYSHTSMDINESNPVRHYELQNRMHMKLNLMGTIQPIHVTAEIYLDVMCKLQAFTLSLAGGTGRTRVEAARKQGNQFEVTISTREYRQTRIVLIPDDVVLQTPQTEMAVRQLRPGQQLTLRTLDPITLATTTILIKALRREPLTLNGTLYQTTVLATEAWGATSLTWLAEDGQTVRQETPFGWVFERCSPEEAYRAFRQSDGAHDALASMAVTCNGRIPQPRRCPRLVLRLQGASGLDLSSVTARQTTRPLDDGAIELSVTQAAWPDGPAGPLPDDLAGSLDASPFIQSDHPDIMAQAHRLTAGANTARDKALAIARWVDREVADVMTPALPSALDVLRTRQGDCNEHTYLFTALARAAGLPTKVMVGLAYHENAFYYHAWPAVYVGSWVEMDPTWGQDTVDATHIALFAGELQQQYQLVKVLGQLQITVLDAATPTPPPLETTP